MFANQYEEHLASQPDNSCWDGFDRGTVWADEEPVALVLGRMTNKRGQRVVIEQIQFDAGDSQYTVYVNGMVVFRDLDKRAEAFDIARSWMGVKS